MYSRKSTNQQLTEVQRTLNYQLQYYPIDIIQQFKAEMDNLINLDLYNETKAKGKAHVKIEFKSQAALETFKSPEVQQIIQNELIISQWDCWYWMERYYQISDITNRFILYKPIVPQQVWSNIFGRLEEAKRALILLCLKARQTSMTTFAQGVVQHRISFLPNIKALISSKQDKDTFKMSRMLLGSLDLQPYWLRPFTTNFKSGEFYIFDNGSYLDLGYGTQHSLGRGQTPTVAHLSEIASYLYPYESIENALGKAMHETIWMLKILEGTAEGRDDWLHEKWKNSVIGHEKGTTSIYPTFIPYCARLDIYPAPAWLEARKEYYTNWIPKTETIIHAKKCENYIRTNPDLREVMGSSWSMPRIQMFWYELTKEDALREGNLNAFYQEVPSDPEEAFQHAGKTIYPIQIITHFADSAQREIPEVYKLKGHPNDVSMEFWPLPDEILEKGKTIKIRTNWREDIPYSEFQLIQIKFDGWDKFDPINKILIWEHPIISERVEYGGSLDTSDGLGEDISDDAVIEIFKKGTVSYNDKQVCEFASPEIPEAMMWPFLMSIFTYYSPLRQLLATVECNRGYEAQNSIIKRGWVNLYKSYDESRIGLDISKVNTYGIKTTPANRDTLIGHLNAMILGKFIDLHSMNMISEMKDLQKVRTISNKLKIQRDKILGKKDNRILSTALNIYALHRDEIQGFQKASWESRRKESDEIVLQELTSIDYLAKDNLHESKYYDIDDEDDFVGSLFEDY
jgi:hypothetical protein